MEAGHHGPDRSDQIDRPRAGITGTTSLDGRSRSWWTICSAATPSSSNPIGPPVLRLRTKFGYAQYRREVIEALRRAAGDDGLHADHDLRDAAQYPDPMVRVGDDLDHGELDLNVWGSLIVFSTLDAMRAIGAAATALSDRCLSGLEVDEPTSRRHAQALIPHLLRLAGERGYRKVTDLCREEGLDPRRIRERLDREPTA